MGSGPAGRAGPAAVVRVPGETGCGKAGESVPRNVSLLTNATSSGGNRAMRRLRARCVVPTTVFATMHAKARCFFTPNVKAELASRDRYSAQYYRARAKGLMELADRAPSQIARNAYLDFAARLNDFVAQQPPAKPKARPAVIR